MKLLEQYLRLLLSEESQGLDPTGLAAATFTSSDDGESKGAVAYRVDVTKNMLMDMTPEAASEMTPGDMARRMAEAGALVAMAIVKRPPPEHGPLRGAWEVSSVTGPGKQAYALAYALAGKDGIVPDRETVSSQARAAWSGAGPKRKNRLPIDDMETHRPDGTDKGDPSHPSHPYHTDDPEDDGMAWGLEAGGDYLDWVYYPEAAEENFLKALKRNHQGLVSDLGPARGKRLGDSASMMWVAYSFFADSMRGVDLGPYPKWIEGEKGQEGYK